MAQGSIPEIDPNLTQKINALKAMTTVHGLLNLGCFQYGARGQIEQSIAFISELHSQLKAEVLAHPDADKVPELKALKPVEETKDVGPTTAGSDASETKEASQTEGSTSTEKGD